MYRVELYARVRRACHIEKMSIREAARVFEADRKTVRKMPAFSVRPGHLDQRPRPANTRVSVPRGRFIAMKADATQDLIGKGAGREAA